MQRIHKRDSCGLVLGGGECGWMLAWTLAIFVIPSQKEHYIFIVFTLFNNFAVLIGFLPLCLPWAKYLV